MSIISIFEWSHTSKESLIKLGNKIRTNYENLNSEIKKHEDEIFILFGIPVEYKHNWQIKTTFDNKLVVIGPNHEIRHENGSYSC